LYHEPADHPKITATELAYIRQDEVVTASGAIHVEPIPMIKLASYPVILKATVAYALYLYVWTVFLYWIPTYLMKVRGLSLKEMGIAASIPYIVAVVAELIGGKVFDKWYEKGATISQLRRTGMGIGMFGAAIFIWFVMQAETAYWAISGLAPSRGSLRSALRMSGPSRVTSHLTAKRAALVASITSSGTSVPFLLRWLRATLPRRRMASTAHLVSAWHSQSLEASSLYSTTMKG